MILKGIGTVTGAGTMGLASAKENRMSPGEKIPYREMRNGKVEEYRKTYGDPHSIRDTLDTQTSDLLETLSDRDYLEAAKLDYFPTDAISQSPTVISPSEWIEGSAVDAVEFGGEETAIISTSANVLGHSISVYVQPERDHSYALIEDPDGDSEIVYSSGGDHCCPYGRTYYEACSPTGCGDFSLVSIKRELYCCCWAREGCPEWCNGYTCEFVGTSCVCSPNEPNLPC